MARVPGLRTIINEIKDSPDLTKKEKQRLANDARRMASDGKLTSNEKTSLRERINGPTSPTIIKPPTSKNPIIQDEWRPEGSYGGGTSPMPATTTPPPTPVPQTIWDTKVTYVAPTGIKQANPDIIVFDEEIDPEFLVQMFFQEFGGTELINISRYDLINGEQVSYSPIINLSSVRQSFNPNNIIAIGAFQENPTKYGIDLFSRGVVDPYFDDEGNLIIEVDDVRPEESIEVEIASDGTINRIEL